MKYYLAPMEGLTTYIFRNVWNQYYGGMDQYFTPFLCNKHMNSRERNDILPEHNSGMNTVPQILTNKAEEFLSLAEQLKSYGYTSVNLNLGCPSGTVVAKNRGAGFLGTPYELEQFLDKIFEKCTLKISIKTRIGILDMDEWAPLLRIYSKFPLEELIIHPRFQKEGYSGTPHLEAFAEAMSVLNCPLCYNGDITSPQSLTHLSEHLTGIRTVMIGRGILQNPNLLSQCKGIPQPDEADRRSTLQSFHNTLLERYTDVMSGDTNTLYKMKDLWTFLIQDFEGGEKYLKKIKKSKQISEYKIITNQLFRDYSVKLK